jgi:hypothetical protein
MAHPRQRLSYGETPAFPRLTVRNSLRNLTANMSPEVHSMQTIDLPSRNSAQQSHRAPPSEIGHWVRTAGILAPLIIGELVKDPDKKWRFIRITSVAMALVSEGLHAHRIQRERREPALAETHR